MIGNESHWFPTWISVYSSPLRFFGFAYTFPRTMAYALGKTRSMPAHCSAGVWTFVLITRGLRASSVISDSPGTSKFNGGRGTLETLISNPPHPSRAKRNGRITPTSVSHGFNLNDPGPPYIRVLLGSRRGYRVFGCFLSPPFFHHRFLAFLVRAWVASPAVPVC